MNWQLKVLLVFNAVMFGVAGLLEWRYYIAQNAADGITKISTQASASIDAEHHSALNLEELHNSFQNKLHNSTSENTLSHGLIAQVATQQATKRHVPGDGSSYQLANAAVLLICFNRTDYLGKTLASLAGLAGLEHFTVYVSQDGQAAAVKDIVQEYGQNLLAPPHTQGFQHWQRDRVPQLGAKQPGHAWLSQHYKWALDRVLLEQHHSHVIIVEDDMLFSPDFLRFFQATGVLLEEDPSLWCISTWNDNGLKTFDWDPVRMMRTSYFPGLGWMMRRELWLEVGPHWPQQSWDHWMRLNTTSQGRECIIPEVNRNFNIGEEGVNMNSQVFRQYLSRMAFNQEPMNDYGDLSYLTEAEYEQQLVALSQGADLMSLPVGTRAFTAGKVYLGLYTSETYPRMARKLSIWPFPRGHHRFLTRLPVKGATLLLADQRFCPMLPDQHKLKPQKGLTAVAGAQHESCSAACRRSGMNCDAREFWFINSCEELSKYFPCEKGCAIELGPDIPNYVLDKALATHQTCLVNQRQPKCDAANPASRRLCPCVPKPVS